MSRRLTTTPTLSAKIAATIIAASLSIGANVFMFSQRYEAAEELITAGVAVSTALALLTVSLVMALVNCL